VPGARIFAAAAAAAEKSVGSSIKVTWIQWQRAAQKIHHGRR